SSFTGGFQASQSASFLPGESIIVSAISFSELLFSCIVCSVGSCIVWLSSRDNSFALCSSTLEAVSFFFFILFLIQRIISKRTVPIKRIASTIKKIGK